MNRFRHQTGAAVVEFAFLLPLLIAIMYGITEFGRALYQYNTLVKVTRDAARYMAMMQAPGITQTQSTNETAAKCLAVYGNTNCSGNPLLGNLSTSMVTISYQSNVSTCPTGTTTGCNLIYLTTVCINGISASSINGSPNPCSNSTAKYTFSSPLLSLVIHKSSIIFNQISATMRMGAT